MSEATEEIPARAKQSTRFAGAAAIMMVMIFASRLLGLVRDAVISGKFGQGYQTDIYNAAFMIPDLLFFLVSGGALSSAFIPVFTEKLTQEKPDEAWNLFSIVSSTMLVVVTLFVVLTEVIAGPLIQWMNYGFSPAQVADTLPLTRIVLPAQICFFMGGLLMGVQNSKKQFFVPALGPVVYNVGIIVGGVALAPSLGIAGLCWGALGGAIIGNLMVQIWGAKRQGMHFKLTLTPRHPDAVRVWKLMLPVILGVALPQVSLIINRMFASELDAGSQSALSNANRIMQAPLGIFAQAMAVAIFPTMSALAANKEFSQLRSTASLGIRSILFLTIPASLLLIALGTPIVQLLLQHGKFTARDTALTVSALNLYSLGIFAWSAQAVLGRGFYALQDTRTPVVIGTCATVVFIPLNFLFMKTLSLGIIGLALATTVAAALNASAMFLVLRKRLGGLESGLVLNSSVKSTVAAIIGSGAAWLIAQWIASAYSHLPAKSLAITSLSIAGAAGIGLYALFAKAFKIAEFDNAVGMLKRRRRA